MRLAGKAPVRFAANGPPATPVACGSFLNLNFYLMRQGFLRWAGSKKKLLPELLAHAPPSFDRYIEPFAGSACFFFSLSPKQAILGDINQDLIQTYQLVKDDPEQVYTALKRLKKGKTHYLKIRAKSPSSLSGYDRAARFIYLNRYCFNGLYRTNLAGQFNVPYGAYKSGNLPSLEDFKRCARSLANAQLCNGSFERVLNITRKGDFVYMDPPYRVESRRIFREYSAMSFSANDLTRLRSALVQLDHSGIKFLVSYARSSEANLLKRGFNSNEVHVRRNIAGFADHRRVSKEIFISNY